MAVYARFKSVTFQFGCGLPNRAVISVTDALAMRAKIALLAFAYPIRVVGRTIRGDAL